MAVYQFFEDTAFTTGETGVEHDVETDLGRLGTSGYMKNTGAGALTFSYSVDGSTYGDEIRLSPGETHNFERYFSDGQYKPRTKISSIKVTWVANTSYKIYVD